MQEKISAGDACEAASAALTMVLSLAFSSKRFGDLAALTGYDLWVANSHFRYADCSCLHAFMPS
jgi:hypothetical protein